MLEQVYRPQLGDRGGCQVLLCPRRSPGSVHGDSKKKIYKLTFNFTSSIGAFKVAAFDWESLLASMLLPPY